VGWRGVEPQGSWIVTPLLGAVTIHDNDFG
jgi:hypothetical protein